jgi:hypothetical protein
MLSEGFYSYIAHEAVNGKANVRLTHGYDTDFLARLINICMPANVSTKILVALCRKSPGCRSLDGNRLVVDWPEYGLRSKFDTCL